MKENDVPQEGEVVQMVAVLDPVGTVLVSVE